MARWIGELDLLRDHTLPRARHCSKRVADGSGQVQLLIVLSMGDTCRRRLILLFAQKQRRSAPRLETISPCRGSVGRDYHCLGRANLEASTGLARYRWTLEPYPRDNG